MDVHEGNGLVATLTLNRFLYTLSIDKNIRERVRWLWEADWSRWLKATMTATIPILHLLQVGSSNYFQLQSHLPHAKLWKKTMTCPSRITLVAWNMDGSQPRPLTSISTVTIQRWDAHHRKWCLPSMLLLHAGGHTSAHAAMHVQAGKSEGLEVQKWGRFLPARKRREKNDGVSLSTTSQLAALWHQGEPKPTGMSL